MHRWGDGFQYFAEVSEAAHYIGSLLARYGRIRVTDCKEKFGESRVYMSFGLYSMYHVIYPRNYYNRWMQNSIVWLWLESRIFTPLFMFLNPAFIWYQRKVYIWAYTKAIRKWPMIREEIKNGADYYELIEDI